MSISPRWSSSGYYSTITHPSSVTSTSVREELSESATLIALIRVREVITCLPSRGFLGKVMFDSVDQADVATRKSRELGSRCWSVLTKFDGIYLDIEYYLLINPDDKELREVCETVRRCWAKCLGLVEASGLEFVRRNPAYLRSSHFDSARFVSLSLRYSLETRDTRHQWVRILNLLESACVSLQKSSRFQIPRAK